MSISCSFCDSHLSKTLLVPPRRVTFVSHRRNFSSFDQSSFPSMLNSALRVHCSHDFARNRILQPHRPSYGLHSSQFIHEAEFRFYLVSQHGSHHRIGVVAAARGSNRSRRGVKPNSKVKQKEEASDKARKSDSFVSKFLEENPSQVEPRVLVDGKLYTLREIQEMKTPLLVKFTQKFRELVSSSGGKKGDTENGLTETDLKTEAVAEEASGKVNLKQILRPYKNKLYVPEEVFSQTVSESEAFEEGLKQNPSLSLSEFLNYVKYGQVKMLLSRAEPVGLREMKYFEFLVKLKEVPGQKELHRDTWSLRLPSKEAQIALSSYSGPQMEVEEEYLAFASAPLSPPNPISATLSKRILTETAAFAAILAGLASLAAIALSALSNVLTSAFSFLSVHVIWPCAKPVLIPLLLLSALLLKGGFFLALGALNLSFSVSKSLVLGSVNLTAGLAKLGFKGVFLVFSELTGVVFSKTANSTLPTLSAMLFVFASMAALAKFTLTRKTRDYTKWDIWQAIEFGQSKADARVDGQTGVKFDDVAGIDEAVTELQDLVAYLKNPDSFNLMGTKPPHGVLLEGPPGCGKTLLAKAIAGEAGVPFYQMAGSEFTEILVGIGAARVRDLFKRAKINRPAVVFIDEVDAMGAKRLKGNPNQGDGGSTQERETTLNQLLVELDGFDTGQGVIFLAATNRVDMLDPALMRPGRFDRKIRVKPAGPKGRYEILKVHSRGVNMDDSVDLMQVSRNLPGLSGAQLAQLVKEAAIMAAQRGAEKVTFKDMDRSIDRLVLGLWRARLADYPSAGGFSLVRRMAAHEFAIGMVASLLRRLEGSNVERVQRISVLPCGQTMSRIIFDKTKENLFVFETRRSIIHRMMVYLAGRAAEELLCGRNTSSYTTPYAADASWLAYKLVSIWHMGDEVVMRGTTAPFSRSTGLVGPPVAFEKHLYDTYGFDRVRLGGAEDDVIERLARKLFNEVYAETVALLDTYKAALVKGVHVLVEEGELYVDDVELILDLYPADTPAEEVEAEDEPSRLTRPERTFAELLSEKNEQPIELLESAMSRDVGVATNGRSSNGVSNSLAMEVEDDEDMDEGQFQSEEKSVESTDKVESTIE